MAEEGRWVVMLTEHSPEIGTPDSEQTSWTSRILVPEMWGTAAISIMWLAVLFVGVYGPSIVVNNSSGYSHWPVVVVVAFFAFLGTVPVARRAFGQRRD
jgi:hypothetical protein